MLRGSCRLRAHSNTIICKYATDYTSARPSPCPTLGPRSRNSNLARCSSPRWRSTAMQSCVATMSLWRSNRPCGVAGVGGSVKRGSGCGLAAPWAWCRPARTHKRPQQHTPTHLRHIGKGGVAAGVDQQLHAPLERHLLAQALVGRHLALVAAAGCDVHAALQDVHKVGHGVVIHPAGSTRAGFGVVWFGGCQTKHRGWAQRQHPPLCPAPASHRPLCITQHTKQAPTTTGPSAGPWLNQATQLCPTCPAR